MALGDIPWPPDDDAIEKYRDKDVLTTYAESDLPYELLAPSAPNRRQHMLTVLKWVLAHVEAGYTIHRSKLHAFDRTIEVGEYGLENKSTLATEVQQAYRNRKQGEGVQALFERNLEDFVDLWEQKQEHR